jgi:uncharacterized membrane protein YagU involved in acid resistance
VYVYKYTYIYINIYKGEESHFFDSFMYNYIEKEGNYHITSIVTLVFSSLFVEPVLFSMLSGVFPTIRLWSQDTTSKVIEFLFEFNSFFGLQGEADYYRPLTQRIFEILESSNNSVMITGI